MIIPSLLIAYLGPSIAAKFAVPAILNLLLGVGVPKQVASAVVAQVPTVIKAIMDKMELGHPVTPEEKERLEEYQRQGKWRTRSWQPWP